MVSLRKGSFSSEDFVIAAREEAFSRLTSFALEPVTPGELDANALQALFHQESSPNLVQFSIFASNPNELLRSMSTSSKATSISHLKFYGGPLQPDTMEAFIGSPAFQNLKTVTVVNYLAMGYANYRILEKACNEKNIKISSY